MLSEGFQLTRANKVAIPFMINNKANCSVFQNDPAGRFGPDNWSMARQIEL
jgi:hypothetical protein